MEALQVIEAMHQVNKFAADLPLLPFELAEMNFSNNSFGRQADHFDDFLIYVRQSLGVDRPVWTADCLILGDKAIFQPIVSNNEYHDITRPGSNFVASADRVFSVHKQVKRVFAVAVVLWTEEGRKAGRDDEAHAVCLVVHRGVGGKRRVEYFENYSSRQSVIPVVQMVADEMGEKKIGFRGNPFNRRGKRDNNLCFLNSLYFILREVLNVRKPLSNKN